MAPIVWPATCPCLNLESSGGLILSLIKEGKDGERNLNYLQAPEDFPLVPGGA